MMPFIHFTFWVLALLAVFVIFRLFGQYKVNTFQAIVFNYLTCAVTGFLTVGITPFQNVPTPLPTWFWVGIVVGGFFITTFYVIARSTQIAGIAITTLASRISFFIPTLFSLFIFEISTREWGFSNYLGVLLALASVGFAAYRPGMKTLDASAIRLPIYVFLISGTIDTTFNYLSISILPAAFESIFSILLFGVAGLVGTLLILFRHFQGDRIKLKSVLWGIALGIPNYFSVYLMLVTLRDFGGDGAFVFPMYNILIIIFSTLISVFFFREKLSRINFLGIGLALIAILLIVGWETVSAGISL
ncbi:MAG: hypothetical protein AAF740_02125 [Bacteroidota bacterium]